jgi:hypothetical protein
MLQGPKHFQSPSLWQLKLFDHHRRAIEIGQGVGVSNGN